MIKKLLALVLLCTACSGDMDLFPEDYIVPGQEGRIDHDVYYDGFFNTPEAKEEFCTNHDPDAWFCSNVGTTKQAWWSEQYHGGEALGTCYGPNSAPGRNCLFPNQKRFKITVDTSNCFQGAAPPAGPSTLQEQQIIDGFVAGMKRWHGTGSGTVSVVTSGGSGYIPITVTCASLGGDFARAGLDGTQTTVVSLPVAPNGKDQYKAVTASRGSAKLDVARVWTFMKNCSLGQPPTQTQINAHMGVLGAHEMGHPMGFAHFNSQQTGNIMYPTQACSSTNRTIGTPFGAAMLVFDPQGGTVHITGVNGQGLGSYSPL